VSDAAAAVGAAAGAFTPREPRQNSGGYVDRRNGGDRGGYGGDRNADRRGGFQSDQPPPEPNKGLYIGNLLFDVTAADLEREFGSFGTITSAKVATDARGLSKG
jgi:nucleolin